MVDPWTRNEAALNMEKKNFTYPPSFQVFVISSHATAPSFMKIQFSTGDKHKKNNFLMNLPLDQLVSSPTLPGKDDHLAILQQLLKVLLILRYH